MEVDRFDKEKNDWKREIKNVLPQGAPTSPVLTNVICSKLDRRLSGIAKRFGLNYTRYADDITFSSSHNVYQEGGEFLDVYFLFVFLLFLKKMLGYIMVTQKMAQKPHIMSLQHMENYLAGMQKARYQ